MANTVDYVPFATGVGAAVMSQATYLTDAPNGNIAGLADETFVNKAARQSSMMTSALANLLSNYLNIPILDDGNLTNLINELTQIIPRAQLTANTSFYVNASTGNDSNNGLTSGTPWLTLQHAWNTIRNSYDLGGFIATINCVGAFTTGLTASGPIIGALGASSILFLGNAGSPGSVTLTVTAGDAVDYNGGAKLTFQGFTISAAAGSAFSGNGGGSVLSYGNIVFGTCTNSHISVSNGANAQFFANYSISGGASEHWATEICATIVAAATVTITLTGTPTFSVAFAVSSDNSSIRLDNPTVPIFTGSANGSRYQVLINGTINTGGAGSTYLPGSSGGTNASGGQYV
jgi:hypothetical protein